MEQRIKQACRDKLIDKDAKDLILASLEISLITEEEAECMRETYALVDYLISVDSF